jgi:hypothetical protein
MTDMDVRTTPPVKRRRNEIRLLGRRLETSELFEATLSIATPATAVRILRTLAITCPKRALGEDSQRAK